MAIDLNNLAGLYRNQGKYIEAEPLYKQALAVDEKALGPDHPETATDLNNLAGLYESQGKYDEAVDAFKKALSIQPGSRKTLEALGETLQRAGRPGDNHHRGQPETRLEVSENWMWDRCGTRDAASRTG